MDSASVVSISDVVDRVRPTRLQFLVFGLCTLIALLDGLDSQSIGIAAPLMSRDLRLSPNALGVIFSISQLGAAAGAMTFGYLGDRFGRKPMILLATALVSTFTGLTSVVSTFYPLLLVRTAAGIGLGGALPLVMALASEYAPRRLRGAVVTIVFAGYPLGGALGGVVNGLILSRFDWQAVFYIGAAAPALVCVLVAILLPESIQYLLTRNRPDLAERLLRRIDPGVNVSIVTAARDSGNSKRTPIRQLLAGELGFPTLMIWGLYFFSFATLKVITTWFPTILKQVGFSVSVGGYALGAFNLGAAVGMAAAGWLTDRFGSARTLVPALTGGAAAVYLLGVFPATVTLLMVLATLIGLFIGIGGSGANAIAARLYPPQVRSTGMGLGVASSRLGQVMSPMLVAMMMTGGFGSQAIYAVVGLLPLIAAVFVLGLTLKARANSVNR